MRRARFGIAMLLLAALPALAGAADFEGRVQAAADRVLSCVVHVRISGTLEDPTANIGGSGVIIDAAGLILTNYHVVQHARRIVVLLPGSDLELPAELLGEDVSYDLALLSIDAGRPLPYVKIGDSGRVRPGQLVLAAGSPLGLRSTVSIGLISFVDRPDPHQIIPYLQVDALIDQGSSGGGVFNLDGELIGVIKSGIGRGIGLAVPAHLVSEFADNVRSAGVSQKSWIGLALQPLSPELAEHLGLAGQAGVVVSDVAPGSPAALAGILPADLLVEVNGASLDGKDAAAMGAVMRLLHSLPVGRETACAVYRRHEGRYQRFGLEVVPVARPTSAAPTFESDLGFIAEDATNASYREHYLDALEGVIVSFVRSGSPAERAALQPHDVILNVEGRPVSDVDALRTELQGLPPGRPVLFEVQRTGRHLLVLIEHPLACPQAVEAAP